MQHVVNKSQNLFLSYATPMDHMKLLGRVIYTLRVALKPQVGGSEISCRNISLRSVNAFN